MSGSFYPMRKSNNKGLVDMSRVDTSMAAGTSPKAQSAFAQGFFPQSKKPNRKAHLIESRDSLNDTH